MDLLRNTILEQLKIVYAEVIDRPSGRVGHGNVDGNNGDVNPKSIKTFLGANYRCADIKKEQKSKKCAWHSGAIVAYWVSSLMPLSNAFREETREWSK